MKKITSLSLATLSLCALLPKLAVADESLGSYSCFVPAGGIIFKNTPERCGGPYTIPARSSLVIDQDGAADRGGESACVDYFVVTKVENVTQLLATSSSYCGDATPRRVWDNATDKDVQIWIKARLTTWVTNGAIKGEYLYRSFP